LPTLCPIGHVRTKGNRCELVSNEWLFEGFEIAVGLSPTEDVPLIQLQWLIRWFQRTSAFPDALKSPWGPDWQVNNFVLGAPQNETRSPFPCQYSLIMYLSNLVSNNFSQILEDVRHSIFKHWEMSFNNHTVKLIPFFHPLSGFYTQNYSNSNENDAGYECYPRNGNYDIVTETVFSKTPNTTYSDYNTKYNCSKPYKLNHKKWTTMLYLTKLYLCMQVQVMNDFLNFAYVKDGKFEVIKPFGGTQRLFLENEIEFLKAREFSTVCIADTSYTVPNVSCQKLAQNRAPMAHTHTVNVMILISSTILLRG